MKSKGKGDISDDAYHRADDAHVEPAPSYSTTVVEIEDAAPPRYSVTAREILSALKNNKNLRRPSWFHYGESSDESDSDGPDDVFHDAVSELGFDNQAYEIDSDEAIKDVAIELNAIVLDNQQDDTETEPSTPPVLPKVTSMSRTTSTVSLYSSDQVRACRSNITVNNPMMAKRPTRLSVEFSPDGPTFSSGPRTSNYRTSPGNCSSSDQEMDEEFSMAARRKSKQREAEESGRRHQEEQDCSGPALLRLVCPSMATVMILDDDHHGIFSLTERGVCLTETVGTYNMQIMRCGGSNGRIALSYKTEEGTAKAGRDFQHIEGEVIFEDGETEKSVPVQIMVKSSYEIDVLFYFTIGEPKKIKDDGQPDPCFDELSMRAYSQLTEQERVAMKGRPQLGEVTTTNIRLKESKEFKNTVDKLMKTANATIKYGSSSWKQQIIDAVHLEKDEEQDEGQNSHDVTETLPKKPTKKDYAFHAFMVFWRVTFAIIPPECIAGGYPCFIVSVICIGIMTSLIGDVASHLGCTVGLKDSVTALAFVSLGTSLPDLFASKVAAVQDEHADASISNVMGSNAVNVFLGIGVAWSLAAFHHSYHGTQFRVDPGTLAFSVTLFCCMAVVAVGIMLFRRTATVGGELGGPVKYKLPTTILLVSFFFLYILLSSLEAYDYIQGF